MKVEKLIPSRRIAGYVERILVIEAFQIVTPFVLPLFANGSPALVFNSVRGAIKNSRTTHLTVFGQTIVPETFTIDEPFTLIAYFFKPCSIQPVFGVLAGELTDKPVSLELLLSRNANRLQEQLLNASTTNARIALLDNYIAGLINYARNDCLVAEHATNAIASNCSGDVLTKLQKELCLTERTFQRMFEKNTGISPNLYRRICQFNAGFQQLNDRRFTKLSDIAFDNGYADQSHYIRSFKEFTNLTPKDYLNLGSA